MRQCSVCMKMKDESEFDGFEFAADNCNDCFLEEDYESSELIEIDRMLEEHPLEGPIEKPWETSPLERSTN